MTILEEANKRLAWLAATEISGNPNYRYDCDNRLICWSEYGKNSEHGWHIDHILPTILGGANHAGNFRARHWRGNCRAGGILGALIRHSS